jgi:hypothetical protein
LSWRLALVPEAAQKHFLSSLRDRNDLFEQFETALLICAKRSCLFVGVPGLKADCFMQTEAMNAFRAAFFCCV